MWDLTGLRFTCNSRKLFKTHFWGPFSFDEKTVDGKDYLNMLQLRFLPKLPNNERCIFQQDGAPPHWALATRAFLNDELPGRWIGRCSARDQCLMPCPPPLSRCDPTGFFLVGLCKRFSLCFTPSSVNWEAEGQNICCNWNYQCRSSGPSPLLFKQETSHPC